MSDEKVTQANQEVNSMTIQECYDKYYKDGYDHGHREGYTKGHDDGMDRAKHHILQLIRDDY